MKKFILILLLFVSFSAIGQTNRFPSIDSLKTYILKYVRNSTVESFTNLRLQNAVYGTAELLDSLTANMGGGVDSIWKSAGGGSDTLKYSKGGTTYTIGVLSNGAYVPYTGATADVDLGNFGLNAKGISVTGTAGNGHLHLKHQSSAPSSTGSSTTVYADANGNLAYKNDGLNRVTFNGLNITADRTFSFQNKSYTLADSADVAGKQGALTLTTTGSSGAATLIGDVLNIPQYSGGGGGSADSSWVLATADTIRIGAMQNAIANDTAYYFGTSNTIVSAPAELGKGYADISSVSLNLIAKNNGAAGSALQSTGTSPVNSSLVDRLDLIPTYASNKKYIFIQHGENDAYYQVNNPAYGFDTTNFKTDFATIISNATGKGWPLSRIKILSGFYSKHSYLDSAVQRNYYNASRNFAAANGIQFINVFDPAKAFVEGSTMTNHYDNKLHSLIANIVVNALADSNFVEIRKQVLAANDTTEAKHLQVRNFATPEDNYMLGGWNSNGIATRIPSDNFVKLYGSDPARLQVGNISHTGNLYSSNNINAGNGFRVQAGVGGFSTGSGFEIQYDAPTGIGSLIPYNWTSGTAGNVRVPNGNFFVGATRPASTVGKIYTDGGYQGLGYTATGSVSTVSGTTSGVFSILSGNIYIYGLNASSQRIPITIEPYLLVNGSTNNSNINLQVTGTAYISTSLNIGSAAAANSKLQTTSIATGYTGTATGITLSDAHNVVEVTATGQTITLPTAVGITGRIYTIKLTASGTGTVATTSSQTIDGSTTYSLSAQYKYVTVQSNGSNWIIIGNN